MSIVIVWGRMMKVKQEDIDKFKSAMWDKYNEVGLVDMIEFYAEAMAYQNSLVEVNFEIYKNLAKALRTNRNDGKDQQ